MSFSGCTLIIFWEVRGLPGETTYTYATYECVQCIPRHETTNMIFLWLMIYCTFWWLNQTLYLDQVWSILPTLELLPLNCSRRCGVNSQGGATPMQSKWIKLDLRFTQVSMGFRVFSVLRVSRLYGMFSARLRDWGWESPSCEKYDRH